MKIIVDALRPQDFKEASRVLAEALCPTPNFTAVFRNAPLQRAVKRLASATRIAKLQRKYNYGLTASLDGQIIGAINMIQSPHCRMTFFDEMRFLPRLVWAYGKALPRIAKLSLLREKKDPASPHWHLGPLGVLPEYQGHGIGSMLLQEALNVVDQTGMDAYLETASPHNVRLYKRFGFETVEQMTVLGNTNWLMIRKGRNAELDGETSVPAEPSFVGAYR